jgi:putative MFS transporter
VFVMIGLAMLTIIVGIGVFGPRTNGRSLETLSHGFAGKCEC